MGSGGVGPAVGFLRQATTQRQPGGNQCDAGGGKTQASSRAARSEVPFRRSFPSPGPHSRVSPVICYTMGVVIKPCHKLDRFRFKSGLLQTFFLAAGSLVGSRF